MKILKNNKKIIFIIFLFMIISLLSIYSAQNLLSNNNLVVKQLSWYIVGIFLIYIIINIKNEVIYKYIDILYIIGNFLLILLLIFGKEINGAKCWFIIPGIGSFQPSEFIKIIIIIKLSCTIKNFRKKYKNPTIKDELLFLIKIFIIILIPSIFTFLQPDTGIVLIYLLITIIMLFISGIRYRWFTYLFLSGLIIIGSILFIYFYYDDLFIKIFGTDFFLRIDRLLDWSNSSGYQLQQGLSAIGSGGIIGSGLNKTPIYFPEPQTDFIFAVYASNFGFIGSLILILLIIYFDILLINKAVNTKNITDKFVVGGILGMLLYQQIQNIGMTLGLLPITGITLPFISYGGSSLLSYMLALGLILNINKK